MLGVGWTEMLVIGVVALIVIGPKDLPVVMNRLGKVLGSIRRMGSEFQREINRTTGLDQITDIRKTFTEPLKQTAADIRKEFNSVAGSGATVPSGAIMPKNPAAESVVDEIHARVGMSPATPAMTPLTSTSVESPAPVEAIAPVSKPRKSRAKPAPSATADVPPPMKTAAARAKAPTAKSKTSTATAKAPAKPRKPRTPKPAAEA